MTAKEYSTVVFMGLYRRPGYIFMTIAGVVLILGGFKLIPFYTTDPYLEIFIGLYFLLFPLIITWRFLRQFRSTQRLEDEITYTFSEAGVNVRTPASQGDYPWPEFLKRKEIGKFLILYYDKNIGTYVDKTQLTAAQLEFIRSKVRGKL